VGFASGLACLAIITQVPRLWGFEVLWNYAYLVGVAVMTPGFYLGASAFDRWAARRAARRPPRPARPAPAPRPTPLALAPHEAQRRVRRSVWWYRGRRAFCLAVALGSAVGFYAVSEGGADSDQRLIDGQPHRTVTVVAVHRSPLDRSGPDVVVEIDGRRVTLGLSFSGDADARVGDRLVVVQDPTDPSYAIAVTSHDDSVYGWWWFPVMFALGVGAVVAALSSIALPWRARLGRVGHSGTVTVCTLERLPIGVVLRTPGGDRWEMTPLNGPRLRSGPATVVGELVAGAWVAVATPDGVAWPCRPLVRATVPRRQAPREHPAASAVDAPTAR
jgi:hypothetical protein